MLKNTEDDSRSGCLPELFDKLQLRDHPIKERSMFSTTGIKGVAQDASDPWDSTGVQTNTS
jgi:hypothetical protein